MKYQLKIRINQNRTESIIWKSY